MSSSSNHDNRSYRLFGVRVDALPMSEAVSRIIDRSHQPQACYVTKPYVEFIDRGARDHRLRQLLNDGWLSLPDGVSLQWGIQYLYGGPRAWWRGLGLATCIVLYPPAIKKLVPEKYSGATFTWKLLEACVVDQRRVYLIGSPRNSSIAHTAQFLQHRLPELQLVGTWPGSLGGYTGSELAQRLEEDPVERDLVAELKQKQPDIILVGMGFPLQERLMAKLAGQLPHGVLIGEGGTFDYDSFGGRQKRAPGWLRRVGLEWLWRLILQPSRWQRQLAIPRFIWRVLRQAR
jgi:N-acetylglucosaminyldiphosphoundecaprenol N-acetyl-beta-D-mannosaminyltransferase